MQYIFAYVLIHFRELHTAGINENDDLNDNSQSNNSKTVKDSHLTILNSYFHLLQEKLNVKFDLYKLDYILEDHFLLTKKYLNLIETDSWSSNELTDAFTWLGDLFIRKLIQISAQIDAKDPLCSNMVNIFTNLVLLFAIDYELLASKVNLKYSFLIYDLIFDLKTFFLRLYRFLKNS